MMMECGRVESLRYDEGMEQEIEMSQGLPPLGFGVALVGMSGSGKSSLGKPLARALGLPFVDIDQLIERKAGMSVRSIFELDGEPGFRMRECEALSQAFMEGPNVIAVGAGAVSWEPSQSFMKMAARAYPARSNEIGLPSAYLFVEIQASDDELAKRLWEAKVARPLLDGKSRADELKQAVSRQRTARAGFYRELAHMQSKGGPSQAKKLSDAIRVYALDARHVKVI